MNNILLRDYFAGLVMQAILGSPEARAAALHADYTMPAYAYLIADAMLKERLNERSPKT